MRETPRSIRAYLILIGVINIAINALTLIKNHDPMFVGLSLIGVGFAGLRATAGAPSSYRLRRSGCVPSRGVERNPPAPVIVLHQLQIVSLAVHPENCQRAQSQPTSPATCAGRGGRGRRRAASTWRIQV